MALASFQIRTGRVGGRIAVSPQRRKELCPNSRRRFVQGIATEGVAAVVGGRFNMADAETIVQSSPILTGNQFDLLIEPHDVDFAGKRVKAIKINGSLPGPTLKRREGETVTVAVTNHFHQPTSISSHGYSCSCGNGRRAWVEFCWHCTGPNTCLSNPWSPERDRLVSQSQWRSGADRLGRFSDH
jgi:FtsP/CotA-like multicopper oxidase with cupredoxin domain